PELSTDSILNSAMLYHFEIAGLQFVNDQKMQTFTDVVNIGILVYPDFFTLDAIGALVVLSQLPNVHVELISTGDKSIKSGRTYFGVDKNIAGVNQLDVLLIPGGADGTWAVAQDQNILGWIKHIDHNSRL